MTFPDTTFTTGTTITSNWLNAVNDVCTNTQSVVNILSLGADPTGTVDSSTAIKNALASASHVIVPSGTFRCDTMIELNTNKTLELQGGATLLRTTASSSTDPVVWIKGSSASLLGAGQTTSNIVTQNDAPNGVVLVGHFNMTASHGNVNYCTIENVGIEGRIAYGQTTGTPDVALLIQNPQFGGFTSYFHNIFGLRLSNANFGLELRGYANANTISNLQGYRLGNTTLGANTNAFIYCHGALDNSISTCFFHQSPNSIGLLVNDYNNTGSGGINHIPISNSFIGLVFEQGGATAYGVKALTGSRNVFIVRDNVVLGNSLYAGALASNFLLGYSNNVQANSFIANSYLKAADYILSDAEIWSYGATRSGDSSQLYVARKTKRNATTNAATVTFTLSCTAQASIYRHGYVKLKAAGGDSASGSAQVAEFLLAASALNTAYPTIGTASPKTSSGDTGSFTLSAANGVLTVATTLDNLVCELEFGFTTTNVNVE